MPETREYTVYRFNELPEDARQKVLERYRDFNVDNNFWYDHFNDQLTDDLKEFGLCFDSFSFCGFYSQGDGASIKYSVDDTFKFMRYLMPSENDLKTITRLEKWASGGIDHDTETPYRTGFRYYRDYHAIEFSLYQGDACAPLPRLTDFVSRLNKASKEFHKDICQELYIDLKKEYEYRTSDEGLTEYFASSDYMFTNDGEIE